MSKIAILFSGHLRNIQEIISNLKNNFLNIIHQKYNYDIYIHTWDDNISNDKNDKFYNNETIDIKKIFENNKIKIKKILIENQDKIKKDINLKKYIDDTYKYKFFYGNTDEKKKLIDKLFWTYYGHQSVLNLIDKNDLKDYSHIIKTRPDIYYDKFDLSLFENNIFFPNSHLYNGKSINQIFFGGKTKYMIKILNYFNTIIYNNKNVNVKIINDLKLNQVSFNSIFRNYIIDYLKYNPKFVNYDPGLYRKKNLIIKMVK